MSTVIGLVVSSSLLGFEHLAFPHDSQGLWADEDAVDEAREEAEADWDDGSI